MQMNRNISLFCFLCLLCTLPAKAAESSGKRQEFRPLPFTISETKTLRGEVVSPEALASKESDGAMVLKGENASAVLVLDLGEPSEVRSVRIKTPGGSYHTFLREISLGSNPHNLRALLGRSVNLPSWKEGGVLEVPLPGDSVGKFLAIELSGGYNDGAVSKLEVIGRKNIPERHLLFWAGDLDRDYKQKIDFMVDDLGITDIWLDYIETAFPQTNSNASIDTVVTSGVLETFKKRGVRYWLGEHEFFCELVNTPEDLKDDLKWATTLRQARLVYAKAKAAGFHGLQFDAEDYATPGAEMEARYKEFTGHVTGWSFKEEFGYDGLYYRRGLEFGRMLKEVWDCPVIQLYEARLYADKNDARAGNYWWLKGMFDAGVTDISIATEKSYGAGNNEIAKDPTCGEHLYRWFIRLPDLLADARKAYPFARRFIPLFHPWNTRTGTPMYLPKYLEEQISDATKVTTAFGFYFEGNTSAGDPRDVLKPENLEAYGLTPESYLEILRTRPSRKKSE
jgi:hypothetical protein